MMEGEERGREMVGRPRKSGGREERREERRGEWKESSSLGGREVRWV